jgi:hypothetical protein
MDKKFRIKKIETFSSIGEVSGVYYIIQRKFLFFWIPATVKYGYTSRKFSGSYSNMMIKKEYCIFDSIDIANSLLRTREFNEKYKGNNIEMIYCEEQKKEVFVNKSNVMELHADTPCYEYSYSLDELKSRINRREKPKKNTIRWIQLFKQ